MEIGKTWFHFFSPDFPLNLHPKSEIMIEHKIREVVSVALKALYDFEIAPEGITIEKTRKEFTGDYTLVVFPFLKASRKAPDLTAAEIGNYIVRHVDFINGFTVIKGFLNIELTDKFWCNTLSAPGFSISRQVQDRPVSPVVLEYSSPNTNKPLHLGHVRNNLLGASIAEILTEAGHEVVRVNLVNDRGIHICKSMLAYQRWGNGETPASSGLKGDHLIGRYYVLFDRKYKEQVTALIDQGIPQETAEKSAPLILEAQELLRKWETGDQQAIALWKMMNGWVYEGFDATYKRLGIRFEKTYHESETYLLGKAIVEEGLANGQFHRKEDGSVWVDLKDEGLDEKLLLRSDGTSVYITQDLGTAQLRFDEYHPEGMIYVVGNEQNYHFDVLKKILKRLRRGFADSVYHLSYGMVELPDGKMKSREGTVVDADDLMEEMYCIAERTTRELGKAGSLNETEASSLFEMVGIGALKYFILKVDPKKNMLFDPNESIDFNGNTAPFIQYTHARIRSLLTKALQAGHSQYPDLGSYNLTLLLQEREVIRLLYQASEIIRKAAAELNPAVVANYVFELSKSYNHLYQELPVLKETDPGKRDLRINLAARTGETIARMMKMLGIGVPESM